MNLQLCSVLLLLATVTSGPLPNQPEGPPTQEPAKESGGSQDEKPDVGAQGGDDRSKVTIEAGHYKVTLDQEILDIITDFFNTLDTNGDDILDSAELADQWEQLDLDSNGVLSSAEVHTKLTWFELYALDVDGDGIATSGEFERATKSLDIDGNGKVEFNEFIVKTGLVRNMNKDTHNLYKR